MPTGRHPQRSALECHCVFKADAIPPAYVRIPIISQVNGYSHLWAIAIFRSWRILFFYGVWATGVCLIHHYVWNVALQSTLLTV